MDPFSPLYSNFSNIIIKYKIQTNKYEEFYEILSKKCHSNVNMLKPLISLTGGIISLKKDINFAMPLLSKLFTPSYLNSNKNEFCTIICLIRVVIMKCDYTPFL